MSRSQFEAVTRIASLSASPATWDIAKLGHLSVSSAPKTPTSTSVVMLMHTTVQIVQRNTFHPVAPLVSKAASNGDHAMKVT